MSKPPLGIDHCRPEVLCGCRGEIRRESLKNNVLATTKLVSRAQTLARQPLYGDTGALQTSSIGKYPYAGTLSADGCGRRGSFCQQERMRRCTCEMWWWGAVLTTIGQPTQLGVCSRRLRPAIGRPQQKVPNDIHKVMLMCLSRVVSPPLIRSTWAEWRDVCIMCIALSLENAAPLRGDSVHERAALLRATIELPNCRSKSIKFVERPDIDQMLKQHALVTSSFDQIVHRDGNLDLCINCD